MDESLLVSLEQFLPSVRMTWTCILESYDPVLLSLTAACPLGFCHEHALILYVYLTNEDSESVLTV